MSNANEIQITIPSLTDVPELGPVPDGEYTLRVAGVINKMTSGDNGKPQRPYFNIMLEVVGEDSAEMVFHSLFMPLPSDMDNVAIRMLNDLKKFVKACDGNTDAPDPDEWLNAEFDAYLVQKEFNNRVSNEIKNYV